MRTKRTLHKTVSWILTVAMLLSMVPSMAFATGSINPNPYERDKDTTSYEANQPQNVQAAAEVEGAVTAQTEAPTEGYTLIIYNADGTEGFVIDGTKSLSEFSVKSAMEDARVFVNNAFLFGIKTPATYLIEMYEDSTENASFEIGSDVTINGNGHNIVLGEGVVLTNNGTLNDVTIVEPAPAQTEVRTYEELLAALEQDNANIIMMNDITATATQSSGYGVAGIVLDAGDVLDGNGKTLTINGASTKWDCAIAMRGGEVKNLTIAGAMRGVFMPGANGNVVIDNCKFKNVVYTFNSDAGSKDYSVTIKDTVLAGWTSFSNVHKSVTFVGCTFTEGCGYEYCRPYQAATFVDCEFNEGFGVDTAQVAANELSFTDCIYDGEELSASNGKAMFADGSKVVIDGESVDFTEPDYAVMIGDQGYATLAEAVAAVQEGETITMLADIELTSTVKVTADKTITLDLNGKTIDGTGNVRIAIMSYGDLTVKDTSAEQDGVIKAGIGTAGNAVNICGGTFTLKSGSIYSLNNAILIDENAAVVNIEGGKITAEPNTRNSAVMYVSSTTDTKINITGGEMIGYNGILLWNNTEIEMSAGFINATGSTGIQGNGSKDNTKITITGGSVSGYYAAIYHPQGGELNISGGELTGWTGVVVKGGTVNISGGTISGTGAADTYRPVSSGYVDTGDALYVEHYDSSTNSENYGTPVVTVTGGTFTSANGKAVASYVNSNNNIDALAGFISGGTFSTDVSALCADGLGAVADENGKFTIIAKVLPNAEVKNLGDITVSTDGEYKFDGSYYVYDLIGGSGLSSATEAFDLSLAMEFIAKDTAEQAAANAYGNYTTDFFIQMDGVEDGSFVGTDCYLAGYYPDFGAWVKIPLDGFAVEDGKAYPVITSAGFDFKYVDICSSVQDFICGIYLTPEVLEANPNMNVTLTLGLSEDKDAALNCEFVEVDDYTYTAAQLMPKDDVAEINGVGYSTLAKAFAAAKDGDTIKVLSDIATTESITNTKKVTLDLNGKTIEGTDNATASFGLITNKGNLTIKDSVGDGKITLIATNNRGWNAYSSVISNTVGGKLIVESGTIEHLGGTDMAYGIDNLTNGKGTYAETIVNGGTVKSTYRAIRQFLNGVEAQNILTVNGGTIEGTNKSIWMQDPSKNANCGTLTVGENAVLYGDVYLSVTAGSTEWPVKVSVATSALKDGSEVVTGNILEGYMVVEGASDTICVGKLPNADVVVKEPLTLAAYEYLAWPSGATDVERPLEIVMNFKANDTLEQAQANTFGKWKTDFYLTVTGLENGSIVADNSYLAGNYGTYGWIVIPTDGVTIEEGVLYPVVSAYDANLTYENICDYVKEFTAAIHIDPAILEANPNMKVELSLKMTNPYDENQVVTVGEPATYTANELLGEVELPEVEITDIKGTLTDADPDLTFALNFAIKDLENLGDVYLENLMEAYGDWYTDYVLTISGLTDESVTFNADGNADGYLAGQYDNWSENWVSVPFDDVTVQNGESLYIMATAAELMGKNGLRFTLAEIAEIVQNFNCGVYFTPEFLAANPNMEVELELKVFTEDENGNITSEIEVAVNEFAAKDIVAVIAAEGEQTQYFATLQAAINAAQAGETITLLTNIELTETVTVPAGKTVTLDLNGKTVSGTCNASQSSLICIENGAALTVKDSVGTGKITYAQGSSNVGWTIDVKGAFTLESGTIELTGSWSIGYAVDVRPNSWGTEYTVGSVFTMNGGKIDSSDGAVRVASSSADAHKNVSATFIMNGGEIDADWDGVFIQQSDSIYDMLTFTMNGGTIKSDLNPVRVYGPAPTSYVDKADCMNITFNGGTCTYTGSETYEWLVDGIVRLGGGMTGETLIANGDIVAKEAFVQNAALADGYEWKSNGDGTYGVVKAEAVVVDFVAIQLSAEAEVVLRLKFTIPDELLNDTNAYVILTEEANAITKVDQVSEFTMAELKAQGTDSSGRYVLEQGIAAGEMTGDISVQFIDGNGNVVMIRDYMDGSLNEKLTRTVLDYTRLALEKGNVKMKNLSTAMVTFGGYAQSYYGVDTSNPAYNVLEEFGIAMPDVGAISADTFTQELTRSGKDIGIKQTTQKIGLDSRVYMTTYFELDEGASIDNYTFMLTYTEGRVEKTIELEAVEENGRYRVDIQDIPVAYWDYMYKITVTDAQGDSYEVSSSILAWAKRCIQNSSNQKQVNMAKAMYYYNQAANEYFGK